MLFTSARKVQRRGSTRVSVPSFLGVRAVFLHTRPAASLVSQSTQGRAAVVHGQARDHGSHHVKGNHIAERDVASLVPLDQTLVDQDRATASRQAQYKGLFGRGIEGSYAALSLDVSFVWIPLQG